MDINVRIDNYILNCRSVGIIKNNNKILFQKRINDKYWALPGGKISIGEIGEETIKREILEEIGVECNVKRIHSIVENFFMFNSDKYHQYIFCYILDVESNSYIYDKEEFMDIENKNIIYKWIDINDLYKEMIKPDYLKKTLSSLDNDIKFITNDEIGIGGRNND